MVSLEVREVRMVTSRSEDGLEVRMVTSRSEDGDV